MIKYNLKIIWRNFKKDKATSLINLIGLSTGLTCALLILLWGQDELRMDKFHEKDDQLYQVMQKYSWPDGIQVGDWTPGPLARKLMEEVPEVEYASSAKMHWTLDGILTYENQHLRATPIYVEEDYFNIFSYPLLHGSKNQVLADKYAVIISEALALKLFPSTEDAIGETIVWDKKSGAEDYGDLFTITGVFKNIPANSTDQFDLIFNYEFYAEKSPGVNSWNNDQASTYVVLKEGADVDAMNEKITNLIASNRQRKNDFFLKKYSDKYLYGNYENGTQSGGRIEYVWLFSVIALLILLIASINFMNLSTARATIRAKEIGVKKALGASRKKLIFQFINESLLISFTALLIAFILVELLLPQFNHITGKQITLTINPNLLASFFGITFITGILSSIYPSLYLSGFNPVHVLKGKLNISFGELWARKGLVIFQFAISVVLIISVLVIYQQMNYIQSKNLGYDRDNILSMKAEGALEEKLETFLSEVKALPEVVNATNSDGQLVGRENGTTHVSWPGKNPEESILLNVFTANYDFIETFGIQLKEGRTFSPEFGRESSKVILNEAAVRSMGLTDPIGKMITFWDEDVEIVGITEDFQYQSLYKEVEPSIIRLFKEGENYGDQIWVKIKAGQEVAAIENIAGIYNQFNPGYPFEFGFVDEEYQAMYESENRIADLSKYFAGVAIIISCLGLFGLVTFSSEQRTKEIGVRKVLGATVGNIIGLLSKDFVKLVMIGFVIAAPVAWYIMNQWLQNFTYRIEIGPGIFAIAGGAALLIALATVSWQSIKAALMNPVNSLRSE